MSKDVISVAIADDHPLVLSGLQSVLKQYEHIDLIDSYKNGATLLEGLSRRTPDVLLLDIQMPDKTADKLVPLILSRHVNIKIVILTNFDSSLYINNMFKLGIHGYLLKNAEEKELIEAIETVYGGNTYIEIALKEKMGLLEGKIVKSVFTKTSLTPREKEILRHIGDGKTNQEIADTLFLSIRTIENYRLNIQLKLGAKNTAVLIRKAMQLGLLDSNDL